MVGGSRNEPEDPVIHGVVTGGRSQQGRLIREEGNRGLLRGQRGFSRGCMWHRANVAKKDCCVLWALVTGSLVRRGRGFWEFTVGRSEEVEAVSL